jgi:Flp pilus assembly protein TadD
MTSRAVLSLSLSALMLGGSMVGCTAGAGGLASASSKSEAAAVVAAGRAAADARRALASGRAADAVSFAERAVALSPRDAGYRALLGQSYLKAGRFTAAGQALADALTLDPANGGAALNLALAQIGSGEWSQARRTLDAHAEHLQPADRGLAMALAGDPQGAVPVLMDAARSPDATPKVRQNLALSLALAGRWAEARGVAGADVAPQDLDARMAEWAAFANPTGAADQVAALLGVRPIVDAGQPVALALAPPAPAVVPAQAAPVQTAAADAPAPVAVAATMANGVRFAARQEVVQPLSASELAVVQPIAVAARTAAPARRAPAAASAKGEWFVQLGAFDNAAVARDGWSRATRRLATLKGHVPAGMPFASKGASFYRLSVGGFARADADALCRRYRAKGGSCFVRQGAGDRMAQWLARPVQLASR